jgi:hypothetical protein
VLTGGDSTGTETEGPAWRQPDFVFDVLETPLRDLSGDIIYEEDARGHSTPARRFSPDFWRDRFQAHRIVEDARQSSAAAAAASVASPTETQPKPVIAAPQKLPSPPVRRGKEARVQFFALLKRAFFSKLRNRANLVTTLLEAPLLAVLVGTVLRYSEDGEYTFASAFHIPAYLFLSLVVGMFLGLTNSADEIIRDRALLQRERNQSVRMLHYIASKFIALSVFALLQCIIYILIGNTILEIRGMFWIYLGWMLITALNGVTIGLLISSFVKDSKTALNWIPIVLIPQIILGGALIKYEEMNRNLDFVFNLRRWTKAEEDGSQNIQPPSKLKVPFICEFMPLRWSYEGIVIAQYLHNPIDKTRVKIERTINELKVKEKLTDEERDRFEMAKQAIVLISSLEAGSPSELRAVLAEIVERFDAGTLDPSEFAPPDGEDLVTGEDIYINQKILDLVTKAEMERTDYRDARQQNVFFGTEKSFDWFRQKFPWIGSSDTEDNPARQVKTLLLNKVILFGFIAVALGALSLSLHRKLTRVT